MAKHKIMEDYEPSVDEHSYSQGGSKRKTKATAKESIKQKKNSTLLGGGEEESEISDMELLEMCI